MSKDRTFIPRAQQPGKSEAAPADSVFIDEARAKALDMSAFEEALPPVTADNIEQVLAEAPVPKRSEILKQPVEAWSESDTAHRLRQCVNFLHAHGTIPDGEAIRLKEEIEQQERT
jgi:DNA-directed RNA polymerase specialized sigma24 family protein